MAKRKTAAAQPANNQGFLRDVWFALGGNAFILGELTESQVLSELQTKLDASIDKFESDYLIEEALASCNGCETRDEDIERLEGEADKLAEHINELIDEAVELKARLETYDGLSKG